MGTTDPLFDSALHEAGWLQKLARSLVKDAHRAEDAVQETLTTALERPGEVRASPRGWLATVLRNHLRQEGRARLRRERHERAQVSERAAPSALDLNERLELQALLLDAVRGLEEPYRSTIVARFFDELAPREIARRAGLPVKTVNTRLERGLAKLRARLDGKFGGERSAWLRALLPFAGQARVFPWSHIAEGLGMGTKVKLAAGLVAALGVVWFGRALLTSDARSTEPRIATGRVAEQDRVTSAPDSPAAGAALLAPVNPETEVRLALDAAPPPAPAAACALDVRIVKRHGGAAPRRTKLFVTDAAPESGEASALFEGRSAALAQAEADASGRAHLVVPAARALWIAVDPGRWDQVERNGETRQELLQRTTVPVAALAPGEQRELVIEIEHGSDRVLAGQVVAAEDGHALEGARIEVDGVFGSSLASDTSGSFELSYASWDPPPRVRIAHDGYTPKDLRPQWVDQLPGVPIVVALEREARIEARVEAAGQTGITLRARAENDWGDELQSKGRLDEGGRGELAVPARMPLTVELVDSQGVLLWREPEPWTLDPAETRALTLRLGSGTLVFGTLLDSARNPIADQELWAVAAETGENVHEHTRYLSGERARALLAHTDAAGRFEFTDLGAGSWWIGPAPQPDLRQRIRGGTLTPNLGDFGIPDPGAVAPLGTGVELLPGEPSRRVDLIGQRGLWIRGHVRGEDGRLLPDTHVSCGRPPHPNELQGVSNARGEFLIGPLAAGTYELRASGGDGVFGWPGAGKTVEAGDEKVELVLESQNAIGGRVVDGEGRATDARVHLLRRNGSLGQGTSEHEQGAFLFVGLQAGTWSVQAEAPDGRVAVQRVELADGKRVTDVVLSLREGTRIGVRHNLDHGVRCAIWAGDALAADSTIHPGEENFETVPAGPIRVELYSGDRTLAVRELLARVDRVESLEIEL